ncbi:uncharacterized protein Dwil_GK24687 [Drosophila willistoni]|uniref:TIMELESS-interacting protein n=1 Tax=Drosophila willistoni TaxID=7260 RepID=B4MZN3_DROWI|nr:protein TIPIN homolog [Drosophila willistoni]EDW77818.1 uncharacterized protein Dwil_GK24687 [Drosophila willistoni]
MASIFGDDGVDDLFNEPDQLPDDGMEEGEKLFADENDQNDENGEGSEEAGAQKLEPPKKRAVRNPRPRLTVDTLRGPRGLHSIEDYFKDMKFKGKGREKDDLDEVLRRLQHWGHRMYPNYTFDDILNNIERLGKKKPLQVHMSRYRLGQLEDFRVPEAQINDDDQDELNAAQMDEPFDEFDALLGEQIAMSKLAPRTPASSNRNFTLSTHDSNSTLITPSFSRQAVASTPFTVAAPPKASGPAFDMNGAPLMLDDTSDYAQPLPPSQPATPAAKQLSAEQMARIAENRRLAQERLKAKTAAT